MRRLGFAVSAAPQPQRGSRAPRGRAAQRARPGGPYPAGAVCAFARSLRGRGRLFSPGGGTGPTTHHCVALLLVLPLRGAHQQAPQALLAVFLRAPAGASRAVSPAGGQRRRQRSPFPSQGAACCRLAVTHLSVGSEQHVGVLPLQRRCGRTAA
jgi:hypothetical protein